MAVKARGNKQIWRMAEWIHSTCYNKIYDWKDTGSFLKNAYYDQAAKLLKKIANNEFTGPDNHEN